MRVGGGGFGCTGEEGGKVATTVVVLAEKVILEVVEVAALQTFGKARRWINFSLLLVAEGVVVVQITAVLMVARVVVTKAKWAVLPARRQEIMRA